MCFRTAFLIAASRVVRVISGRCDAAFVIAQGNVQGNVGRGPNILPALIQGTCFFLKPSGSRFVVTQ